MGDTGKTGTDQEKTAGASGEGDTDAGGDPTSREDDTTTAKGAGKVFTQDELDEQIDRRLARLRRKYGDYEEIKAKAGQYDELKKQQETDQEKAIREAVEAATAQTRVSLLDEIVTANFRAVAAGRIDDDRLVGLIEDIDLRRYVSADGKTDLDKIERKVDAWAPKATAGDTDDDLATRSRRMKPDRSQGAGGSSPSDADRGRAEAERRFGKRP